MRWARSGCATYRMLSASISRVRDAAQRAPPGQGTGLRITVTSSGRLAPVHGPGSATHEGGRIAGQEANDRSHLLRHTEPAYRNRRDLRAARLARVGAA